MVNYRKLRLRMLSDNISMHYLEHDRGIGRNKIARLKNNGYVCTSVLAVLCELFDCEPCELLEFENVRFSAAGAENGPEAEGSKAESIIKGGKVYGAGAINFERLFAYIYTHDISLRELRDETGVSYKTLKRMKEGMNVSLGTVDAIVQKLGCRAEDVMSRF